MKSILLKIDKWIQYFQTSEILLYPNFWNDENKFILKLIYEDSFNKTKILLKSQDKDKKLPKDLSIIKDAIILKELQSIPNFQRGQYVFISADNYFRDKMEGIGIQHVYFSKDDNDSPFKYIEPDEAESLNTQIYDILQKYYHDRKYGQHIEIDNDWNYIDFIADEKKAIQDVYINVRVWHGEPDDCFGVHSGPSRMHERLFVKIIYENDNWKIHYINNEYGRNYYSADI